MFWDPILSGNRDVACASCHHPRFGYAENRDISIGVNGVGLGQDRQFAAGNTIPFVKRNSQTILNVGFNGIDDTGAYSAQDAPMFWDVRTASLEEQALEPIKALEEMRGRVYSEDKAVETVVARLAESDSGAEKTYAFRTASLRNVELTAPYMHSGIFRTLADVLEFYDDVDGRRGAARNANVSREQLDPLLRRLRGVDEDDQDLIAFLGALTDRSFDRTIPDRVPSGLTVGGRIQ